jgi:hypothetical protein
MKYMHNKLIVSIALAGVLWSGAAMAQGGGNQGSGEIPRSLFGGSAEFSRGGVATDLPEANPDEIGRDLELDPDKLRQSYGTVSRSRTGEETREPASETVLRTLDNLPSPNVDKRRVES